MKRRRAPPLGAAWIAFKKQGIALGAILVAKAHASLELTVEKGGKKPSTMVFTRHAEMRTVGELEKDARVTVYYRAEGRETVAVRVVVKPAKESASER